MQPSILATSIDDLSHSAVYPQYLVYSKHHRTPDRKACVRCPMPPNTLRVHTDYVLVKSVGPKSCGLSHELRGTGEYFPSLRFNAKIVDVEIGGVAIYRPFGEFRRAK
ncbi:hypothetical protein TNCV_1871561 [Trichonephila clavipes]|nr:hypothetical protein TNCV_1871561 [Trichonephila clavipes]